MTQPKHAQLDLLLSISDGLSRGSDEMLRVSPTDAMHPPSCSLAIRDAVEELKWLRAEIEWLRALLPPTAHSGVRNGPGEGSWSVFATKVVEERDAARAEVEKQRAEIEQLRAGIQSLAESLRASLDAAIRQRDEARAEIERLREENKEKQAAFHATHVERDDLRATIKRMREQLKDPNVVALNMLHGKIALPSVEQIKHIYQERFLPPDKATVVSERDEALEGKP